jgi:hypothetical protein
MQSGAGAIRSRKNHSHPESPQDLMMGLFPSDCVVVSDACLLCIASDKSSLSRTLDLQGMMTPREE